jgi:hypothetical protein
MQENHLFEYAVVRVVPRVEREEFLNTGVILYCPRQRFLQTMYTLDEKRMGLFCDGIDMDELAAHLRAFELVSMGSEAGGPIARLDMPSRFRWLTATRSTVLQSSKVHSGFCEDPYAALTRLHALLVL